MVFVRLGRDEIQHCRRALHTEESAHHTADGSGSDLVGSEVLSFILLLKNEKYKLVIIRIMPSTLRRVSSCILERVQMAAAEMITNVVRMGMILFHVMYRCILMTMNEEVVRASSPLRVVASP